MNANALSEEAPESTASSDPIAATPTNGDCDPRVVELRSLRELNEWRPAWRRLLSVTPGADFFRSLDWLEVYWRRYGERKELRVLLTLDGDKPTGILPLAIVPVRRFIGELRVLTYPLDWWGSFYGPVGPRPEETLRACLRRLQSGPRDWDYLELRFVHGGDTEQAPADDPTGRILAETGFAAAKQPLLHCARVALDGSWEAYLATRRKSWRENIKRTEKKVRKAGEVTHLRYRPVGSAAGDDDPRWDLYDECVRLASQSWQGSSTDGHTLSHEGVRAYLRDAHLAATRAGCLDLNLLKIDGRAVAFHYGYHFQGYFSGLRLGFDPGVARLGAGTVLTGWMIRDSIERGDHTFDFLPDCLKAKMPWQTSVDVGYRYSSFPSLLNRSQLVRLKNWFDRDVRKQSIVPS